MAPETPVASLCTVTENWNLRAPATNDENLRESFLRVLKASEDAAPESKLIMYDACDEQEVRTALGPALRKRLDARRNTKPKKSDDQIFVCTPFDEKKFHFGKISNPEERLVKLAMSSGRYDVLTNKFPLFPKHMLLVADAHVPQQMKGSHLTAISELLQASTFCAYFNSWCASASVNHFHCHLIDECPPVTTLPLVPGPTVAGTRCLQPQGFSGFCYVFPMAALPHVEAAVTAMQADNQPHNLLFTARYVYVFPKPHVRPARSFELYPETVGGPELIGSFTVYTDEIYNNLTRDDCEELIKINTAPLPTSCFPNVDDTAVHATATAQRAVRKPIGGSRTLDMLPALPLKRTLSQTSHTEQWPQDRPIARALAPNLFVLS